MSLTVTRRRATGPDTVQHPEGAPRPRPATGLPSGRGRRLGAAARTALSAVAFAAAAGVALVAVAVVTPAPAPVDARTGALATFLGVDAASLRVDTWETHETPYGSRAQATVRDLGLAQVDAGTGEVNEVIFERELAGGGGALVPEADAVRTAAAYAAPRYAGFSTLTARGARASTTTTRGVSTA